MAKLIKKSRRKRTRKHGFLKRMASHDGRKIISRRRARRRKTLGVKV